MKIRFLKDVKWGINYKAVSFKKDETITDKDIPVSIIEDMIKSKYAEEVKRGPKKENLVQENKAIESVEENKSIDEQKPQERKFKKRGRPPKDPLKNLDEQIHVPAPGQAELEI